MTEFEASLASASRHVLAEGPVWASSGNTSWHRLNRHGDRQLNRAIHIIARSRMMTDATTKAYIERRTNEGKTRREIHRSLTTLIT